jgi:1-deoxy-D-xylulose-5-phosphate reductoisomerase
MGVRIKRLAVLGSTGSIGRQTLEVVRTFPDRFRIVGLGAGKNTTLLAEQIAEFKPGLVHYQGTNLPAGEYVLLPPEEIASDPGVDTVVIATSGKYGLSPILAAVRAGKEIALSNKESLVMAGRIITSEARSHGAQILPVDSEHSAIWQCLEDETQPAARIILTASGGPFLHYSPDQLEKVTVEQALGHPTWQMGKKITIDSATLMNKGLEIIEARWLFNMPLEKISVVIHPQSIVHSMVEFIDGSIKAQLSYPDMRLPIQYALSYPERLDNPQLPRLDWSRVSQLTFEQPDISAYPCLRLAIEAGKKGGTYPAVLCVADEIAVELFLARRIKFTYIARLVEKLMEQHQAVDNPDFEEVLAVSNWAKDRVEDIVKSW